MGLRVGVGGIAIESSTFSPLPSTLADFTILRGDELLARYPFMPGWRLDGRDDVTWLPCLHARAIPGGSVAADAYAAMKGELLDRIRAALPARLRRLIASTRAEPGAGWVGTATRRGRVSGDGTGRRSP